MRKFSYSATENSVTLQDHISRRKPKFRGRWHKGQKVTCIYIICRTLVSQYILWLRRRKVRRYIKCDWSQAKRHLKDASQQTDHTFQLSIEMHDNACHGGSEGVERWQRGLGPPHNNSDKTPVLFSWLSSIDYCFINITFRFIIKNKDIRVFNELIILN